MAITNYNRIINLKFFSVSDKVNPAVTIECPARGRKPHIEITGQYLASDVSQSFNIRVRNLYLDLTESDYTLLEVEAGYENNLSVAFRGTIIYMFKESPGPESVTVIQCLLAEPVLWQNKNVNIDLEDNILLKDVLDEFCKQIGYPEPIVSSSIAYLPANESQLTLYGKAEKVLNDIKVRFNLNDDIIITVSDARVTARKKNEGNAVWEIPITFMTSPPQLVGGGENSVTATFTSLWIPDMRPGDIAIFNTKYYTASQMVSYKQDTIRMMVISIQVQFSTVGGNNQMICKGSVIPQQTNAPQSRLLTDGDTIG